MSVRQTITRYATMLVGLIIDVVVMGYGIGRKVVLPKPGRKGNLLYSIFFFFTALAERVIDFLDAVVGRWGSGKAWGFGKKYLRLAVLLVTWALCMLASLEWSASTESVSVESVSAVT